MAIAERTQFGPYLLLEKIGAGGMEPLLGETLKEYLAKFGGKALSREEVILTSSTRSVKKANN
jgi:hypothetical protein